MTPAGKDEDGTEQQIRAYCLGELYVGIQVARTDGLSEQRFFNLTTGEYNEGFVNSEAGIWEPLEADTSEAGITLAVLNSIAIQQKQKFE